MVYYGYSANRKRFPASIFNHFEPESYRYVSELERSHSSPQAKKFRKAMLTMKNMPSCCAVCDAQTGYCMNTAYQQNPYHPFFDKGSPDHS